MPCVNYFTGTYIQYTIALLPFILSLSKNLPVFRKRLGGGYVASINPGLCHWAELCQPYQASNTFIHKAKTHNHYSPTFSILNSQFSILFTCYLSLVTHHYIKEQHSQFS